MKKKKEQLRQKCGSQCVIFREKKVNIVPSLQVYSDLVKKICICLTPLPLVI